MSKIWLADNAGEELDDEIIEKCNNSSTIRDEDVDDNNNVTFALTYADWPVVKNSYAYTWYVILNYNIFLKIYLFYFIFITGF